MRTRWFLRAEPVDVQSRLFLDVPPRRRVDVVVRERAGRPADVHRHVRLPQRVEDHPEHHRVGGPVRPAQREPQAAHVLVGQPFAGPQLRAADLLRQRLQAVVAVGQTGDRRPRDLPAVAGETVHHPPAGRLDVVQHVPADGVVRRRGDEAVPAEDHRQPVRFGRRVGRGPLRRGPHHRGAEQRRPVEVRREQRRFPQRPVAPLRVAGGFGRVPGNAAGDRTRGDQQQGGVNRGHGGGVRGRGRPIVRPPPPRSAGRYDGRVRFVRRFRPPSGIRPCPPRPSPPRCR